MCINLLSKRCKNYLLHNYMKVAICFLISYDHIINKEHIWRQWLKPNEDIINVYIHYKNENKIRSPWIKQHCIPKKFTAETDYMHVVSAYMNIMAYAFHNDNQNTWFCMATESCVPIISPENFRIMFFELREKSILRYGPITWNPFFTKRANLHTISKEYHLVHDPWFILTREHVLTCIKFFGNNVDFVNTICQGNIANESIFAIILKLSNKLDSVICESSTVSDWTRMEGANSPYTFSHDSIENRAFIKNQLEKKYTIFLRKVSPTFPDRVLIHL